MDRQERNYEEAAVAYQKRISEHARRHFQKLPGYGQEDLEAVMYEVLWKCVRLYDPDRGASFNTVFWTYARNRTNDLIKAAQRQQRQSEFFILPDGGAGESSLSFLAPLEACVPPSMHEMSAEAFYEVKETILERLAALTPAQRKRLIA